MFIDNFLVIGFMFAFELWIHDDLKFIILC